MYSLDILQNKSVINFSLSNQVKLSIISNSQPQSNPMDSSIFKSIKKELIGLKKERFHQLSNKDFVDLAMHMPQWQILKVLIYSKD